MTATSCAVLRDVTFQYATGEGPALQDVNFDVPAGTLTLVTGPTGSAKSTLARLLGGFVPHYVEGELQGYVELLGRPLETDHVHDIGFVFDNPFDQLSGSTRSLFDEVAFALENAGVAPAEIERRVMRALTDVSLGDRAAQHPREISGGQSQRLALAMVLAQDHSLVILDDPTSQLDPVGRAEVVELVASMRQRGKTVIVTANDLTPWLPITDRLAVMDRGRLAAVDHPRTLLCRRELWQELAWAPRFVKIWWTLVDAGLLPPDTAPLDTRELAELIS